jgi:hypothetical protein
MYDAEGDWDAWTQEVNAALELMSYRHALWASQISRLLTLMKLSSDPDTLPTEQEAYQFLHDLREVLAEIGR